MTIKNTNYLAMDLGFEDVKVAKKRGNFIPKRFIKKL